MKKFYLLKISLVLIVLTSQSQPGKLDLSFGNAGRAYTNVLDINKGAENANGVAIQPDGKIIAVGGTMSPGFIFRYNTDGTLDNSFGYQGAAFFYGNKFTTVKLQSDGKIVAAGGDFSMVRLNANGSYDNSFGTGGKVSINIGAYYGNVYAMTIQPDGKIILVGSAYDGARDHSAIARFNSDGSPDNSFDGDGKMVKTYGFIDGRFRDVALQTDGKIVMAGYYYDGNTSLGITRLNPDGSPDDSFDGDGRVSTIFVTSGMGYSVAIQADGKIVAAGYDGPQVVLARYETNGALDNSFDGDGKVVTSVSSSSNYPSSSVIQPDGKILVAVMIDNGFGVLRYNTNGTPDNSFDSDGMASCEIGGSGDQPVAIALRDNGNIVVGGFSMNTYSRDMSLAVFKDDGSLDNSFDVDGKVMKGFPSSYDIGRAVAFQTDGKMLVGGYTGTIDLGNNNDFAIARYNTDGTLDTGFDVDGKLSLAVSSSSDDRVYALAVQTDGKIIAVGPSRYFTSSYDIAVLRFHPNGTPDMSFDGDGMAIIVPTAGNDIPTSVALQSNGRILIACSGMLIRLTIDGTLDNSFSGDGILNITPTGFVSVAVQANGRILAGGTVGSDFALARYLSNGNPDNTFSGDGYLVTDFDGASDVLASIAVQADGKIVAAGSSDANFAVARYNENGTPDNSFSGDGKQTTAWSAPDIKVAGMAIQSNGKIVLAGEARFSNDDFLVARYNNNGVLDNSFDGDGQAIFDLGPGSYEHAWALGVNNNRIYVIGESLTAGAVDFVVAAITSEPLSGPLPLMLRDFAGRRINNDGVLTWKTEHESGMLEYIVERSLDGRSYTSIGTITANNRASVQQYYFTDHNISSLNTPVVYYRLRQTSIDGKYSYSRVIALALDKDRNIVFVYPNPVVNELNITLTAGRPDKLEVRIFDNTGRLLRRQRWNVSQGSTSMSIDVDDLPAGGYYFEIKGETIDYRKQFVK